MRYSKLLRPFTFFCDIILLNIALYVAHLLTFRFYSSGVQSANFLLIVNLAWISVASVTRNYIIKRPLVLSENISRFLTSMIYHLVTVLGIVYFFKFYDVSRLVIFFTYCQFLGLIIVERSLIFFMLDYIRKKGFNIKHVMIVGNEDIAAKIKRSFAKHPEYGYNFFEIIPEQMLESLPDQLLFERILEASPNEVFICQKSIDPQLLKSLVDFGDRYAIKIKLISDLVLENINVSVVNYNNLPIIQLSSFAEPDLKIKLLKRGFDIVFSTLVMIPGLPVFILLGIITKLTSKGPVFYRQERVGRDHKPFRMYKFRSMYVNSEQSVPLLSKDQDPRITKWGVFLRKSRLDELPQFWNVLKGDMSIVGPRPERQYFIEQLIEASPSYSKLFKLKPGLTSMGQVNYGYAENIEEMRHRVRYDLIYLKNMNFNNDMRIIGQTIKVMVQLKGK